MADSENSDTTVPCSSKNKRRRKMIGLSPCQDVRCSHVSESKDHTTETSQKNHLFAFNNDNNNGDFSPLNDLPDCLLAEILCRVATFKLVIHCKLVCKRWYSLISSSPSSFIPRCLSVRGACNSSSSGLPKAVCLRYHTMHFGQRFHVLYSDSPFDPCGLSLTYLPEGASAVASCNDLLLCWTQKEDCNAYYLCNPLTMQWIAIYSPITIRRYSREKASLIRFGLICEPYYYGAPPNREFTINAGYRFAIVRIDKISANLTMVETYSSETGNWRTSYLEGAEYRFPSCRPVPYNGKLHWYNDVDIVVAYDPIKGSETRFIDSSVFRFTRDSPYLFTQFVLNVSQDRLQGIRLIRNTRNGYTTLSTWELKDYETGKWSLEHTVCLNTLMVTNDSWVQEFLRSTMFPTVILASHPRNKNLIYLNLNDRIVLCSLEKGELELVVYIRELYPGHHKFLYACSLVLPWWPTPLPPVRQDVVF